MSVTIVEPYPFPHVGDLHPPKLWHRVSATLLGSRKCKGYRASIYRCAQECFGRYDGGSQSSIYYVDGDADLHVSILFDTIDKAEVFQNVLLKFAMEHSRFNDKLVLDEEILAVTTCSHK